MWKRDQLSNHYYDNHGRHWRFKFDDAAVARISSSGVDFNTLKTVDGWHSLARDDEGRKLATQLMYALLEPYILRRKLTPEEFIAGLVNCWDKAFEAMFGAWLRIENFSQSQIKRIFRDFFD